MMYIVIDQSGRFLAADTNLATLKKWAAVNEPDAKIVKYYASKGRFGERDRGFVLDDFAPSVNPRDLW